MEILVQPARALDFAEALDDSGEFPCFLTRQRFGLFARQVDAGAAVTLRTQAGELVMIAGLYPAPAGWFEAWWAVGPAMRPALRAALKIWRDLFEGVCGDAAPIEARVFLRAGSVAGRRLAPLFGFESLGPAAPPLVGLDVWRRVFPAP